MWNLNNKKNVFYILACILILGFILRFTVVNNVSVLADEMLHGPHAMNIISSGVINLQNQSPAWFYMTDIAYKIFGITALGARFLSLFFGLLSIILIYLIGKEVYSKRVGLIAAFLLSISAFTIRYTLMEMDLTMIFFILFAFYFYLKDDKFSTKKYIFIPLLLGIAVLVKPITLPFIASFFLIVILRLRDKNYREELIKRKKSIFSSLVILFIFTLPVLIYNYLLFKQKQITDVIFARFLKINPEIYSQLQGYDKTFELMDIFTGGIPIVFKHSFIPLDTTIFVLGLLGIAVLFTKTGNEKAKLFVYFHILPLLFLLGTSWLQTHLVPFMILFSLSAAFFIDFSLNYFKEKIEYKKGLLLILIVIVCLNSIILLPYLTSKSAIFQMREHAINNFEENDLVVVDSRIYGGRIAWMFNDKNYLNANYFEELLKINSNLTSQKYPVDVYFVECAKDDCGWGTIKDQPEVNKSMEQLFYLVKNGTIKDKTLMGGGGYDEETGKPYFTIYKTSLPLSQETLVLVKQTHEWFYYPVRWEKEDWYDKYTPSTGFERTLNDLGKIVLWSAVIMGYLSVVLLIKELIESQEEDKNQSTIL